MPATHPPPPGRALFASLAALGLALTLHPAAAQLVFQPGQQYENVAASGITIEESPASPSPTLEARVDFSRADALTQNMTLYARSATVLSNTARARGVLVVDFCVPRPGASGCDAVSDPNAPDINVNLNFRYGLVGELVSDVGGSASIGLTARLIDRERNQHVVHRDLAVRSVSGAQWITFKGVPVPIPSWNDAGVTELITISTFIRRGKVYRFQLSGAATATGVAGRGVTSNFFRPLDWAPAGQGGRIQLHNLRIQIGQEAPDFGAQIEALQASVVSLGGQVSALSTRVDDLDDDLGARVGQAEQDQLTLAQRTTAEGALLMRLPGASSPQGGIYLGTYLLDPGRKSRQAPVPVRVYRMPLQQAPVPGRAAASR